MSKEIELSTFEDIVSKAIYSIDVIPELDELSTHTSIDEVITDEVTISHSDSDFTYFNASGQISCILQYGSGSDLDRGDGDESSMSFPFKCSLHSQIKSPNNIEFDFKSLKVDTSSFYE